MIFEDEQTGMRVTVQSRGGALWTSAGQACRLILGPPEDPTAIELDASPYPTILLRRVPETAVVSQELVSRERQPK